MIVAPRRSPVFVKLLISGYFQHNFCKVLISRV